MQKKNSPMLGRRAWNLLRLALLWTRKGGLFKNRLLMDLRLFPKFVKSLRSHSNHHNHRSGALHYGERQLSFDDTPVIHVKMHRPSSMRFKMPHIPCINPHVDFDCDFGDEDDDNINYYDNDDDVARKSFLMPAAEDHDVDSVGDCEEESVNVSNDCDEGIDLKAEEFIAKFYQQIKLQRQISYLQYTEMINRGLN
ncbi:hypothetical protein M9H77_01734 [Catharanthus roseus]|uniref:Uncharacterized protein n=1 Tax=Catharanthus roseus TaxID=4058 RepID=A0ACC0C6K9_CATRO|nr:hypothetical protein M9H77_01734 [Catharanthus roseus]